MSGEPWCRLRMAFQFGFENVTEGGEQKASGPLSLGCVGTVNPSQGMRWLFLE